MFRRLGLLTGWTAATAAVVILGWAAVSTVAGTVTERPPLAQPPAAPAGPRTMTQEPAADGPTPAGQPAPPQSGNTRSFDLAGGTVAVRTSGDAVELIFATPQPGFSVDVRSRGPVRVEVRFFSDDHESRFRYDANGEEQVEERPD